MKGAVLVAIAAAVGNLLQGWDNATIAGAVLYVKREFQLETQPTIEGLIVAMSLIGATFITTISGPASDSFGRRPMLLLSSILYFISGLVMLWAPNVEILLLARLLDGFGIGLAVTLVPVYISETAPAEIRGTLNTLPQFTGSVGMFLSYCMVFVMSLMDSPSWRLMLGILSLPSVVYFLLAAFFLPESPRWLVSKGRMKEAKKVLTMLRGTEDVSGEMALLVEGLSVGGETSIEQYIITADNEENTIEKDQIKLYGAEEGKSWMAKPVREPSTLAVLSRHGSVANPNVPLMDPMVTLFGSIHERLPDTGGSMRSMLFPNFGSMFNMTDQHNRPENWDEENPDNAADRASEGSGGESDDNLRSPLLNNEDGNGDRESNASEQLGGMGIGGGWQLAYRKDKKSSHGVKRIYLHQEPGVSGSMKGGGSVFSVAENEAVHAAALVSQSVLRLDDISDHQAIGKALDKQPKPGVGSSWRDLLEPGVKHALVVGVGIQILQQFSGINGVLYYTPQILQQAGVGVLLSNLGMSSDSSSLLISGITTLLMLPSIGFAMRLMDIAGRRWLLLSTIPILLATLVLLVVGNVINLGSMAHAIISTVSVIVYFCCFVMGFGPVPNILCAEIFPTRVRGLCIGICALTFWIGDIIVTYSLPLMLNSIGLGGVFGIYAAVCTAAWFFVFLKVPETKGMPLEVITDFFAVGAKRD